MLFIKFIYTSLKILSKMNVDWMIWVIYRNYFIFMNARQPRCRTLIQITHFFILRSLLFWYLSHSSPVRFTFLHQIDIRICLHLLFSQISHFFTAQLNLNTNWEWPFIGLDHPTHTWNWVFLLCSLPAYQMLYKLTKCWIR